MSPHSDDSSRSGAVTFLVHLRPVDRDGPNQEGRRLIYPGSSSSAVDGLVEFGAFQWPHPSLGRLLMGKLVSSNAT